MFKNHTAQELLELSEKEIDKMIEEEAEFCKREEKVLIELAKLEEK